MPFGPPSPVTYRALAGIAFVVTTLCMIPGYHITQGWRDDPQDPHWQHSRELTCALMLGLLLAFPELVLYLPGKM